MSTLVTCFLRCDPPPSPAGSRSPSGPLPRLIVGNRTSVPVVSLFRSSNPRLCEGCEERRTGRSYPACSRITSSGRCGPDLSRAASASFLGGSRRRTAVPGKVLLCVLLACEFGASQPRPERGSSGPATLLDTAVVVEPCLRPGVGETMRRGRWRAGAHRHGPRPGVAAGTPGDAAARRPSSAKWRPGREERRRGEAGILLATAARLLDGILASVRRYEGVVHHVMFHRGVVTAGPVVPLDLSAATGRLPPRERNWGQRSAELGSRGFLNWGQGTWHCFRRCIATLHRSVGSSLPAGKDTG